MPDFNYVARTADGTLAKGTIQASDRSAAIRQIEALRHVPIKIDAAIAEIPAAKSGKKEPPGGGTGEGGGMAALIKRLNSPVNSAPTTLTPGGNQAISMSSLFLFTEQLAHLLSAGMTLDEALGILVRRLQQPKLQALCKSLHQGLVDGRSLSQVMRDYPRIFSSLYINMVSAGEASGALPHILRRLVTHIAGVKALRDRVTQALAYPAALVVVGIGLIVVFMTVMVPQITGFFTSTGGKLPMPTQVLLAANRGLTNYWWLALLLAGGAFSAWKIATRSPEGRQKWDKFMWNLPAFGRIPRYRFYAQFARTLGTLVENGVTLLKSLELLEDISGNEWVRLQMVDVRKAVMDGASLSNALRRQELFPVLFLDMMSVGEQTGKFADTMQMIADVHERELDKQVQFVSAVIPVLVIIAIAAVVGLVVFGILAAVFNLTSGLSHGR